MQPWKSAYSRGKRHLAHHRPRIALEEFRAALRICPVAERRDLARILFFLGIALRKVGLPSSALKSWVTARNVGKRSSYARMAARFINDYGMLRQMSSDLDDWNAFYAVQLKKYLESKRSRKLGSQGEKDMIWDLIYEYWLGIRKSGVLEGKSNSEKLNLFADIEIIFPFFTPPEERSEVIQVDFQKKTRPKADDPCPCHSGLSFGKCCGRTPAEEELLYGHF